MTRQKTRNLPDVGNHPELGIDLFVSELFLVPGLGDFGRRTEIDNHEYQSPEDSGIQEFARRSSCDGDAQIDEALAGVVRADNLLEPSFTWQSVFLQACQVGMALALLQPTHHEQAHAKRQRRWGVPHKLFHFPRLEDSAFT